MLHFFDKKIQLLWPVFLCAGILSCAAPSKNANQVSEGSMAIEKNLWLEEVEGAKALEWVREKNKASQALLETSPHFTSLNKEMYKILSDDRRIPMPGLKGQWVFNLWTDRKNEQGLWRRTTVSSYESKKTRWEILLDVDELGRKEGESWVFKGSECFEPGTERCLLHLSKGGKDAVVVREFDLKTKKFVKDQGFSLPESKQSVSWIDINTLMVATPVSDGELTTSGYPRVVRILQRGQKLSEAPILKEIPREDMILSVSNVFQHGENWTLLTHAKDFRTASYFIYRRGELHALPIPEDGELLTVFQNQVLFSLRTSVKLQNQEFAAGSVLALSDWERKDYKISLVYLPSAGSALAGILATKNRVLLLENHNVISKLWEMEPQTPVWKKKALPLPSLSAANFVTSSEHEDVAYLTVENYLMPTTLFKVQFMDSKLVPIKELPPQFNAKGLKTEQRWAISKDGTQIPYFLIGKNLELKKIRPTLLYGYGGFEIAETPRYWSTIGKAWLERGGTLVVSNARGGGEFGPKWHQAALREKRQTTYNDFYAIAESLIQSGLTDPAHLGIFGRSNGGLLVGVAFTQRPELFGAVSCGVPLLDMLRFHKLLAGASWMDEYGNPDKLAEAEYISKYSPYQNIADKKYPPLFVFTSTKDDRVHPGHARRFVEKLEARGLHPLYYENTEGGHAGSANSQQKAHLLALEFSFLWNHLSKP